MNGVLLPPRYARWQQQLSAAFFEGAAGKPVILFVDDEELQRISGGSDEAAAELARAVREVANPGAADRMFDDATALMDRWARTERSEAPPVLPILAISSLAAARMHTDEHARRHNYYLRLAQALLPDADDETIDRTRLALRNGAFIPVAEMWQELDHWLAERNGAAGTSTIRDHPTLTRVGFPRSQAMITRADRAALTTFFAALNITELGAPPPHALVEYLRLWAARPRGLSPTLVRVLGDAELRPLLESIIGGLADTWDGRVITPEGLSRCDAAVVIDIENWRTGWAVRSGSMTEADIVRGRLGTAHAEISVEPDAYSAFARCSGLPDRAEPDAIQHGYRLRGSRCIVEFSGADLLICGEHADMEGWVSGAPIEPYAEHVIAARGELAREVRRVLDAAADAGWRAAPQPADRPLLPGFAIFYRASFSDPDRLETALSDAPQLLRRSIRPDTTSRARLVNGLPVAARIGRHHYLAGGEPDLLLPVGDEPRAVPTSLDGTPQEPSFTAKGFPIPLRRIGPLEAGSHTVEADLEALRFVILDGDPAPGLVAGTGEIGWDDRGRLEHTTTAPTRGAAAPADGSAEPVLVRRGASRSWLIHRNGECTPLIDPPPLTGALSEISGISGYYYELVPDPSCAWLAEERRGRVTVRPLRRLGPEFVRLDSASLAAWAVIAAHGPAEDELWALYLKSWARCRGR